MGHPFRILFLLFLLIAILASPAVAQCTLDTTSPSVTICQPANGATVSSPVRVVAGTTSRESVTHMKIYVDGVALYGADVSSIDTNITLAPGAHNLVVQAWDWRGTVFNKAVNIAVSSESTSACQPQTADGVTVCQPVDGATVASPVRVLAVSQSSAARIVHTKVYVDGVAAYAADVKSVDQQIAMANGRHVLVVQSWNAQGTVFKKQLAVNVQPDSGTNCTLSSQDMTVTICLPATTGPHKSPVRIVAGATSQYRVAHMKVYVDGVAAYAIDAGTIDTLVPMQPGYRSVVVQAWDAAGRVFKKAITLDIYKEWSAADLAKIQHIVFYMQENRSYDNYFGRFGAYRQSKGLSANADDLPLQVQLPAKNGALVKPFHFRTVCHENLMPSWFHSHLQYNGGRNDGFMRVADPDSSIDPQGTRAMGYYDWNDLTYYYELAFQFGMSDRFFSSLLGPTIPNRMYLFSGTSDGNVHSTAPPAGGWPMKTIFDQLTDAGIRWRYYYQDNSVFLADFASWDRLKQNVYPISAYYEDVKNESTFPQVVFLERASQIELDEHPGLNMQPGAANTKKLIDALMNSPSWKTSAFILTFDEAGGLYDHVAPPNAPKPDNVEPKLSSGDPQGSFDRLGFRVPVVVMSPYSRPNFVSHRVRDITSIQKFIGLRFGLTPLTSRVAWADDMTEFFDFTRTPFLLPPPLPEQPVNGNCNYYDQNAPGF